MQQANATVNQTIQLFQKAEEATAKYEGHPDNTAQEGESVWDHSRREQALHHLFAGGTGLLSRSIMLGL